VLPFQCPGALLRLSGAKDESAEHGGGGPGQRPDDRDTDRIAREDLHILHGDHDDPGQRESEPAERHRQRVVAAEDPEGEQVGDDAPVLARAAGGVDERGERVCTTMTKAGAANGHRRCANSGRVYRATAGRSHCGRGRISRTAATAITITTTSRTSPRQRQMPFTQPRYAGLPVSGSSCGSGAVPLQKEPGSTQGPLARAQTTDHRPSRSGAQQDAIARRAS
jgi:hypothetical protein